MKMLLNLIVFLPFISAAILGVSYLLDSKKGLGERYYSSIGIIVPVIVTLFSFIVAYEVAMGGSEYKIISVAFNWVDVDQFIIDLSFMADRLSVVMISFITLIGTLIHIYAAGYMKGDEGFGKFFSYFNLFLGSMLLLVLANNPIIMFIGWELVGLASYLLIGFYFKESENITAANKAFIVNRVGDFGFIIGLGVLFVALEGSGFTFGAIEENFMKIDHFTLTIIGICLFIGAMGKSAQVPLYVWLPDAMAGPTPVSALIHAATMVTAGVYMVARFGFLYNEIPAVGEFIAIIGITSALLAAIIASYQSDIKKILAYSTMSQLGYMFVAVGLGAYSFGIFHVFTHAFFKALLFMGAGAVIIALHHEQNIFKMGNLKGNLGTIFILMFIATLAISGIPPFAGFFSKDAILNHAFFNGNYVIWFLGVLTAFMTAYYMFRMLFIVFMVKGRDHKIHPVDKKMIYPLYILAAGATLAGFLGANEAYGGSNLFSNFIALPEHLHHADHTTEYILGLLNMFAAIIGITVASKLYLRREVKEPKPNNMFRRYAINKFYVDEVYNKYITVKLRDLSDYCSRVIDEKLVDGFIGFIVKNYLSAANSFASLQSGNVRYYSIYIIAGVSMICLSLIFILGGR